MEKESIVAPVQIVLDAPAAARQLVTSEIQCHPGFADLHNRLGLLDVYDGRPDRAAKGFREALGINPGYFWGASNLSLALVGVGQIDEALEILRPDSIFSDHPDYARARAAVLLEADLPEEVFAVLDADPGPESAFHHHIRGLAHLKLGRPKEAQFAFLRAAELSTLVDRLYRQRELLGPGALEKISPREAAAPIRVFPGLYELYDFFAEIYARHGFRSRALQSYEQGQVLWPDLARHAWNLGRLASWMGDMSEAKSSFLDAIEVNPQMVDAHIALGMEHAASGEVHRAIEAFERAPRSSGPALPTFGISSGSRTWRPNGSRMPCIRFVRRSRSIHPFTSRARTWRSRSSVWASSVKRSSSTNGSPSWEESRRTFA
jgi:tetratricopeptide (TPR) repeat protein